MKPKMRAILTVTSLAATGFTAGAASAAEAKKPRADQCFRSESYQDFRPIDDHTFNMRANVNDYYRVELDGACPTLTYPDAILITRVRGSDMICGPLDWDLRVGESGPGGVAIGCIVKSQRKLTPEEVSALPPKEKP